MKTDSYTNTSGIVVQVYPYRKPRKAERTWTASKYSIANIGHQSMGTGRCSVKATTDRIGQVI